VFIDLKSPARKTKQFSFSGFKRDFKDGVTFILSHRLLRKIFFLVFIANTFLNPSFTVGVIYVANIIIRVSDFQLGTLQTMMVLGSMAGTFVAGYVSKRIHLPKIVYYALFMIGLIICFIAFNSSPFYINIFDSSLVPYITLISLALLVACIGTITNIGMSTMLQKEAPLDMMGRIVSVRDTISMCAIPIGQMLFGVMLDRVDGYIPLLFSGSIIVLAAIVFNYSINNDNKEQLANENKAMLNA
jgi:predicted MFS family arabinose efflux permease